MKYYVVGRAALGYYGDERGLDYEELVSLLNEKDFAEDWKDQDLVIIQGVEVEVKASVKVKTTLTPKKV